MRFSIKQLIVTVGLFGMVTFSTATVLAQESFGEVGVGAQVMVVSGDTENETGVGFDLRTRFLWRLGLDFSATALESSLPVWGISTYRLGLVLYVVNSEYFNFYLSPGLAGDSVGDTFNPVGDTTWYRLGGGFEFRFLDGFALGLDIHWTLPSEGVVTDYIDQNGEDLLTQYADYYLNEYGDDYDEIPTDLEDVSPSDLLDVLPLDRFEFGVSARYYF